MSRSLDVADCRELQPGIRLRGVRVHNLQAVDLDLPLGRLIVVTGVSGAGKSSLAFDTLYAEGQRRFVESLPTWSRKIVERLEPPLADEIGPMPPAVAVRQNATTGSRRPTLGSLTEVLDHLRILFARMGTVVCPDCGQVVASHSPAEVAAELSQLPAGSRYQICIPLVGRSAPVSRKSLSQLAALHVRQGFTRFIAGGKVVDSDELATLDVDQLRDALLVLDRLIAKGDNAGQREADSIEAAFQHGAGCCVVLTTALLDQPTDDQCRRISTITIDGERWYLLRYNEELLCPGCGREFPEPEPAMLNFNSPLGACPACRGLGLVGSDGNRDALVPCPDCGSARLRPESLALKIAGAHLAEFTAGTVDECLAQLRNWAGASQVGATLPGSLLPKGKARLPGDRQHLLREIVPAIVGRLEYLHEVGLGYLCLDRTVASLSRGEAQRARLAGVFGAGLQGVLYVLDEPTTGLHAAEIERLQQALQKLREMGNTVVVVEHEPTIIRAADYLVDLGPSGGSAGGRVLYAGPPSGIVDVHESTTGAYLKRSPQQQADPARSLRSHEPSGWLRLEGICHRNLHHLTVSFPLGVLCVVSGPSGSGKSSLVEETLYPALVGKLAARMESGSPRRKARLADMSRKSLARQFAAGAYSALHGDEQLDNVVLLDQTPIGRSPNSLPASQLGILGDIRRLFASTADAKSRNYQPRQFSLVAAGGGRCETCLGRGTIAVDMQFLPDVNVLCPDCRGQRFRREILDVKFRGLSLAEVLHLSGHEAFAFFRGQSRVQRRLKFLKDVGLGYIELGQPAQTLSGGESQRLKLASFLARGRRTRTLFILDEPTVGLHPQNVASVLDSWHALLAAGHSLVVIEHNLDVIAAADYIVDLGPGAGAAGGRIVAQGAPADVAACPESLTGRWLASRSKARN